MGKGHEQIIHRGGNRNGNVKLYRGVPILLLFKNVYQDQKNYNLQFTWVFL